jgi:hypothetical protein
MVTGSLVLQQIVESTTIFLAEASVLEKFGAPQQGSQQLLPSAPTGNGGMIAGQ